MRAKRKSIGINTRGNILNKHYNTAELMGLEGYQLLDRPDCPEICNGIGADWFPAWLRWLVTQTHPTVEPASWVHDVEYLIGGGILDRFRADWRFLRNGFRAASFMHSWKSWRRYAAMASAVWLFCLLRLGGQAAFAWR